jgi:hypothetical protein
MKHSFLRTTLPAILLTAAMCGAIAQTPASTEPEDVHGLKVREIHPKATPTPFPLDVRTGRPPQLEFRSPEQMTAADHGLAEANQGEIARRAGLQGFDLGHETANWGYEQAVCPVFPEHLILDYSRSNGNGDVTLFSVVIPHGEGHVRVIPVRRRGYSLFTPSASNALTINDFNHMVIEGHEGLNPDWLTLGLCYAALAGGHIRAALQAETPAEQVFPLSTPAKLTVSGKGGAEVRFADVTPHTKAMDWILIFAENGRLLKVRHTPSSELVERPVPGAALDVTGGSAKDAKGVSGKPGD